MISFGSIPLESHHQDWHNQEKVGNQVKQW